MQADKRYYVNADRSKVVDENDPEATFLLAAEGDDISNEDVKRYGLSASKKKAAAEPEAKAEEQPAETKAVQTAPANKAQSAGAKKDDEGK